MNIDNDQAHEATAAQRASRTGQDAQLLLPAHSATFDHGLRSRFNAWFFNSFDSYFNHILLPHKTGAFSGLGPGTVVELGAGAGANLHLMPSGAHVVAVEPNQQMHRLLQRRASAAGVGLTLVPGVAEALPLPDSSVDDVLCTLVLCTVGDAHRTLAEVKRVLKPGGRFRFVEHVAAPAWSPRRWVQALLRRPWAWVFEGCDCGRDTVAHLSAAGFSQLDIHRRKWRHSAFFPVNTSIWGVAIR